jgi:hypothetical protein
MTYIWRGFLVLLASWLALPYVVPEKWKQSPMPTPMMYAVGLHPVTIADGIGGRCAQEMRADYRHDMVGYTVAGGENRIRKARFCLNVIAALPATNAYHRYDLSIERAWLALAEGRHQEARDRFLDQARSNYRPAGLNYLDGSRYDVEWMNAAAASRAGGDAETAVQISLELIGLFETDTFRQEFVDDQIRAQADEYLRYAEPEQPLTETDAAQFARMVLENRYYVRWVGARLMAAEHMIEMGDFSGAEAQVERIRETEFNFIDPHSSADERLQHWQRVAIATIQLWLAEAQGDVDSGIDAVTIILASYRSFTQVQDNSQTWYVTPTDLNLITALDSFAMCTELTRFLQPRRERAAEPGYPADTPRDIFYRAFSECRYASLMGDGEAAEQACTTRSETWQALLSEVSPDNDQLIPAELTPPPETLSCFAGDLD